MRGLVPAIGVLTALAAGGCEKSGADKAPPPESGGRVDAVEVVKKRPVTVEELCDVHPATAEAAPALVLPPLAEGSTPPPKGTWRWINVWATWCKPCVQEMPLLVSWQKQLAGEGVKVDLVFLSVDQSEDLVTQFRAAHPGTPASMRIANMEALPDWLKAIGVEGAPIPVHMFVDPQDRVRCVRAGSVKETDLPAVKSVLGGG